MKTLLATVATAALVGTAGLAQDAADDTAIYSIAEGDYYASNLLGSRLYTTESDLGEDVQYSEVSTDWNDVGEINDFVVGEDGSVQAIIVGVGGFLGIGEKDVAISWDDVSATYDDDGSRFLVASMTQEALENAPAFEYEELDADIGEATATEGADVAATETAPETEMAEGEATTAEGAETDLAAGEAAVATAEGEETAQAETSADVTAASEEATDLAQAEATDEDGVSTETALADGEVSGDVEAVEGEATETAEAPAAIEGEETETAEAPAATEEATTETAEAPAATEEATTETAEAPAVTEEPATETAEATDPAAAEGAATTDMAAGDAAAPEGFELVQVDMLTTEELEGATVRSANDNEWVGEVGSLILDDEGKITEAVIDVGGFLGIGQKPVAMNFEELQIFRQGDGGALEIMVNSTREELEGMSAYEG